MKSPIQREAESKLREAVEAVENVMPSGIGIALFVFERNTDKGNIGYIANARREDMRRALAEFLSKWEADAKGQPFMPPTLDAFEGWIEQNGAADNVKPSEAVTMYRYLSNASATNQEEVSQQ